MVGTEGDGGVHPALLDELRALAPGTPMRDGLERILRGRTGALVVLGDNAVIDEISTGGFALDVAFTATALRELAKMDGAIVLSEDRSRIVRAGVHLMPDRSVETVETGTRHRTAERVARQAGLPVVSVSSSMATISLFLGDQRHLVEHSAQILNRADQALQTLERYRGRLTEVISRLSSLEVQDAVTVRDVALVAQRLEMVRRLEDEIESYVLELGSDGRLLTLQLSELAVDFARLPELLERDYRPYEEADFSLGHLRGLSTAQLVEPAVVARTIGFGPVVNLEGRVVSRGFRQVAQIGRLPAALGVRLIEHFGNLQALFGASIAELQDVEGVGESRARIIRDGLLRLADAAYSDRLD
ncbi:DNA integrity scanning diadenylate cyclase DisA [Microlunatus flavus]|uniref:DNA integrity scanning protein DisA n=1 Tax=Microlunatus flavus TaxID=1036181 RepID=A0A1H8Z893_9ACTN|nr:DNA integrity scanning diadenylate cyclase DisA [Microlunatus flavus]SEP60477.1 diadenylate cyclase [Microlunatus flavus]